MHRCIIAPLQAGKREAKVKNNISEEPVLDVTSPGAASHQPPFPFIALSRNVWNISCCSKISRKGWTRTTYIYHVRMCGGVTTAKKCCLRRPRRRRLHRHPPPRAIRCKIERNCRNNKILSLGTVHCCEGESTENRRRINGESKENQSGIQGESWRIM